jgi:hypothetical protein
MANLRILALIATGLLGCGGEDEDSFTCETTDRSGTYLISYVDRDGDCGPLPETVGRFSGSSAVADNCELDMPDVTSSDGCTLERSITCVEDGFAASAVASSTQETEDGSRITGILTMTIRDAASGELVCISTYEQTAVRQ